MSGYIFSNQPISDESTKFFFMHQNQVDGKKWRLSCIWLDGQRWTKGSMAWPIFASQGLRSALLIFTFGIVSRMFVIPAHCHLLDFDSYAPCNDVIFSQSTRGFHFLSFECPRDYNMVDFQAKIWRCSYCCSMVS